MWGWKEETPPRPPWQGGADDQMVTTTVRSRRQECAAGLSILIGCIAAAFLLPACAAGPAPVAVGAATPAAARAATPRPTLPLQVDGGRISGLESGALRIFRGIPYAAPPVGALRWRPPQPVRTWSGVRRCTSFGPSCPQGGAPDRPKPLAGSQSEDCLYLNVWAPSRPRGKALPVMVWIHGGGFISGSGSLPAGYGETLSAQENVVVVSLNYRLGVFGFFALPALSAESARGVSGNYGLLDQIAALRWVRRNIAAFGGDPRRVTIFGQSAGGQSVIVQLVSPLSRGLYARAIAESPRYEDRGVGLWSTLTLREQEQEGDEICDGLSLPRGAQTLAALRRVPAARLLATTAPATRLLPLLFVRPPQPSFQPIVDGYVLPDEPRRLIDSGRWARVPLLVGSNRDECNMWFKGVRPQNADAVAVASRQRVAWFTGRDWDDLRADFTAAAYSGLPQATSRMMTVLEFNAPARGLARAVARQGLPSYLYYFSWTPPGDQWGAYHSAEVPYVFGVAGLDAQDGQHAVTDQELVSEMPHFWATFAANGDPNSRGHPHWPRYEPAADVLLQFDAPITEAAAPYPAACEVAGRANRRH